MPLPLLSVLTAALGLAAGFVSSVQARLVAMESFDYAVDPATPLLGLNGGLGWTSPWMAINRNASMRLGANRLFYPPETRVTLAPAGRAASDNSTSATASEGQLVRSFDVGDLAQDGSIVWVSFLFQRDNPFERDDSGLRLKFFCASRNHSIQSGFGVYATGSKASANRSDPQRGRLFIDVGLAPGNAAPLPEPLSAGVDYVAGPTYFVLLRARIDRVAGTHVQLWLNPNVDLGEAMLLVAPDDQLTQVAQPLTPGADTFGGWMAQATRGQAYLGSIDEIRIGTTLESVTRS